MYTIKARFDGIAIIPTGAIPVTGPYEAIVTFTKPVESANAIDEFFGCFREQSPWDGDGIDLIRKMRDEW
jgi:hypothetical protein